MILKASVASVAMSLLSFPISVICVLFFFPDVLARGLLILLISENQLLASLVFLCCFPVLCFVDFSVDFYCVPFCSLGFNSLLNFCCLEVGAEGIGLC